MKKILGFAILGFALWKYLEKRGQIGFEAPPLPNGEPEVSTTFEVESYTDSGSTKVGTSGSSTPQIKIQV